MIDDRSWGQSEPDEVNALLPEQSRSSLFCCIIVMYSTKTRVLLLKHAA